MELASQEYHTFLNRQHNDDGDDRAEIEALKARIRHMEKIDKQRARERDKLKLQEAREASDLATAQRRKAEDLARQEEIASLKAMMADRILQNKGRLRRRAEEERSGVSKTPGAQATGDVWSRGTVSDVVSLIDRQKKRRIALAAKSNTFVAKGLPLLNSMKLRNDMDRVLAQETGLQQGDKAAIGNIPPQMQNLAGVKKLKFIKMGQVSATAKEVLRQHTVPISTRADSVNVQSPAKRILSSVSDKLLVGEGQQWGDQVSSRGPMGRSFVYDPSEHTHTVDYVTFREVTTVSTASNLKYMKVGDAGLEDLSAAMRDDMILTTLCLSGARVSSVSVGFLAAVLPSMSALTYLDLSRNLVCDKGALLLAAAIATSTCRVNKLSLAGNRIQLAGALALVQSFCDSHCVEWMR